MKILVIEDEASLLESICEYLKRDSYICETASSFMDGSEKIHLYDYDCILLETGKECRTNRRSVPG